MGSLEKQRLCNYCGAISTPHSTLQSRERNHPRSLAVLCNACGSRYRLKGSLENYAPTDDHLGAPLPKRPRKLSDAIVQNEENVSSSADDTANKYTSSSATSHLQNCTELKKVDGEQISGSLQPHLLDSSRFPARNRPGTTFSDLSHIESLQRDPGYTVEHDPEASEDVVLIYNANSLLVSPNEIGLGCALLKPPNSNVNPKDGRKDESAEGEKESVMDKEK